MSDKVAEKSGIEVATLGGGCFWCLEAVFEQVRGVRKVESGYAGGHTDNPTYRQVCHVANPWGAEESAESAGRPLPAGRSAE